LLRKCIFTGDFQLSHILNNLINSTQNAILKYLTYSYTSQVNTLCTIGIRKQIGHPFINREQQDAAEFIGELIHLYEPLKNERFHELQTTLICSKCNNTRIQITQNYIIQLTIPNGTNIVTLNSMFNDILQEILIGNINCSACNRVANHVQNIKIINTHQ